MENYEEKKPTAIIVVSILYIIANLYSLITSFSSGNSVDEVNKANQLLGLPEWTSTKANISLAISALFIIVAIALLVTKSKIAIISYFATVAINIVFIIVCYGLSAIAITSIIIAIICPIIVLVSVCNHKEYYGFTNN